MASRKGSLMARERLQLLTAEEAAKYLRLHVKSVYRLAKQGKIPSRKVGGTWRFHRHAIETWLTKGRGA
ncbi:MAG TPA: helix-turn-helix domain-containing protein [candidate division Zixibacteria bacterium]|nr:helix-turn-helix domain-containing protein [candidate division Zixibacteria bacterium]